ncbi:MAG: DinB family protein [Bryobacteraceae bacterium]
MQRAIDYLEQTKATFLAATAGLTEEQWRFKPAADSWSVADCVEHLAVSEEAIFPVLQAMPDRPEASAEELGQIQEKDDFIVTAVSSRRRKATAPPQTVPANRWPASELPAQFLASRDRTIALARSADGRINSRIFPHFVLGPMSGYQWLLFLAAHSDRHLKQMEEVKAHPAFPASR